jgi:6-phosphofructo-2-kinase/fructose-2,6-biphosphatase 2
MGTQIKDYERRVDSYSRRYEPLDARHPVESRWSFFQCDHPNSHFVIHNATGYLFTKAIHFIMNMSLGQHSFFLSRCVPLIFGIDHPIFKLYILTLLIYNVIYSHGESEYNEEGRIGGNSSLSPYGLQYAKVLPKFVAEKVR